MSMDAARRSPPPVPGIHQAVAAAGSQTWLAHLLTEAGHPITPQAICQWVRAGRIPSGRILAVETVTGVPRHVLAPDLYPPPRRGRPRLLDPLRAVAAAR